MLPSSFSLVALLLQLLTSLIELFWIVIARLLCCSRNGVFRPVASAQGSPPDRRSAPGEGISSRAEVAPLPLSPCRVQPPNYCVTKRFVGAGGNVAPPYSNAPISGAPPKRTLVPLELDTNHTGLPGDLEMGVASVIVFVE